MLTKPQYTDDNKLPMILSDIKNANTAGTWNNNNYTYNGITYTILLDEDNNVTGIKANGTASGNSTFKVGNKTWSNISSEDYQLGGCAKNGSTTTYYLALGGTKNMEYTFDYPEGYDTSRTSLSPAIFFSSLLSLPRIINVRRLPPDIPLSCKSRL